MRAQEKLSARYGKRDLKGLIPFLDGLLAGAAGSCLRGTAGRSAKKHSKEPPKASREDALLRGQPASVSFGGSLS